MTEREMLIAETTSAWRPRTPDGRTLAHPAWADLAAADRDAAFDQTIVARLLEAALDREGYSTTVRAVAAVITRQSRRT